MATTKTKTVRGEKVKTPRARLSFPSLINPDTGKTFSDGKYKATFLFDKKDAKVDEGIKLLQKAAAKVAKQAFGKKLSEVAHPFRDGDEKEGLDGYKGTVFITAKSKFRPGVVDQKVQPIVNEADIYGGCYVYATLVPFSYDQGKNKQGVSFQLCNVQKVADGEPFGAGPSNPEDDFDAVESEGAEAESEDEADDEAFEDDDEDNLGIGKK